MSAVGVDEGGVVMWPAATCTRWQMQEKILGSHSTWPGESTVPHKCLHSSTTSSCHTSQEQKKVIIEMYCIKKCLLDLDPI